MYEDRIANKKQSRCIVILRLYHRYWAPFKNTANWLYIHIYIYIYIYIHRQTGSLYHYYSVKRLKLGSKPAQIYIRISILPLSKQTTYVSMGIISHYVVAFVYLHFCLTRVLNSPYHAENTGSRPITEVKQRRAWSVLGWVTAWEYQVL